MCVSKQRIVHSSNEGFRENMYTVIVILLLLPITTTQPIRNSGVGQTTSLEDEKEHAVNRKSRTEIFSADTKKILEKTSMFDAEKYSLFKLQKDFSTTFTRKVKRSTRMGASLRCQQKRLINKTCLRCQGICPVLSETTDCMYTKRRAQRLSGCWNSRRLIRNSHQLNKSKV